MDCKDEQEIDVTPVFRVEGVLKLKSYDQIKNRNLNTNSPLSWMKAREIGLEYGVAKNVLPYEASDFLNVPFLTWMWLRTCTSCTARHTSRFDKGLTGCP